MNTQTGEIREVDEQEARRLMDAELEAMRRGLVPEVVAITAEEAEVLAAEPPGPGRFTMLHQIRGKDRSAAHQAPMTPRQKRRRDRAARKARRQ